MFDYVNRLQLALGDKARRTSLKLGAAVAALIGLGFLIAAVWSLLAWNLELGPTVASLIVGGVFVLVGLVIWSQSGSERHRMPTGDELKTEVEMRLQGAADAAINKVKSTATEAVDNAQAHVAAFFGGAPDKARDLVKTAGSGVGAMASNAVKGAASKAGLGNDELNEVKAKVERAAPGIGLVGAFAVGMAIANALASRRSEDDLYFDEDDDLYLDEDEDDWRTRR
ncbi:phage holin family protein [Paracoccus sp. S1E-3]|uniref:phage holin family protein n=1 Tax=Paracoccus sp. S1E-3 TaxID=2756130 RepID=UPI0015EF8051|nr:phage holin family protein [Paracoccus sp. S1E-3]MBA4489348.1 phage holin family protein [Paracoccus sp. S1E-3]